jgi:hypothetical protein
MKLDFATKVAKYWWRLKVLPNTDAFSKVIKDGPLSYISKPGA